MTVQNRRLACAELPLLRQFEQPWIDPVLGSHFHSCCSLFFEVIILGQSNTLVVPTKSAICVQAISGGRAMLPRGFRSFGKDMTRNSATGTILRDVDAFSLLRATLSKSNVHRLGCLIFLISIPIWATHLIRDPNGERDQRDANIRRPHARSVYETRQRHHVYINTHHPHEPVHLMVPNAVTCR